MGWELQGHLPVNEPGPFPLPPPGKGKFGTTLARRCCKIDRST